MSQSFVFACISIFIYFIGFIPYIYHVFHGKVVPHPFSWTIWFLFASSNLFILLKMNGFTWSVAALGLRSVALALGLICGWWLIRKIKISYFDYFSLLLAVLVMVGITIFDIKEAIIAMVVVDMLVILPTLRKIWLIPETEDAFIWFMASLSQASFLLSLPFLTFENSFFWFYTISANLLIGLFIRIRTLYGPRTIRMRIYSIRTKVSNTVESIFALKNKL